MREFDITITRYTAPNGKGAIQVAIPSAIARGIHAAGYNRAKLTLTKEGILLRPYVSNQSARSGNLEVAELPDWSKA